MCVCCLLLLLLLLCVVIGLSFTEYSLAIYLHLSMASLSTMHALPRTPFLPTLFVYSQAELDTEVQRQRDAIVAADTPTSPTSSKSVSIGAAATANNNHHHNSLRRAQTTRTVAAVAAVAAETHDREAAYRCVASPVCRTVVALYLQRNAIASAQGVADWRAIQV